MLKEIVRGITPPYLLKILKKINLFIQVDDGTNDVLNFATDYEAAISASEP